MKTTTTQTLCITLTMSDITKALSAYLNVDLTRARVSMDMYTIEVYIDQQIPTPKLATLRLDNFGNSKISTTKIVREYTHLGLRDAKDLVESYPCTILQGVPLELAEHVKSVLYAVGADATVEEWKLG